MSTLKRKLKSVLVNTAEGQNLKLLLDRAVPILNRWTYEACALANTVVLFCLDHPTVFPLPIPNQSFFERCMAACRERNTREPVINHIIESQLWSPSPWMQQQKLKCLSYIQQTIGAELHKNATLHLWYHFHGRQFGTLRLQLPGERKLVVEAQKIINGDKPMPQTHVHMIVIQQHRTLLGFTDNSTIFVGEKWLKDHPSTVLKYYRALLTIQETEYEARKTRTVDELKQARKEHRLPKVKLFTLLPMKRYQRAHVTLSSRDLFSVLKWGGLLPKERTWVQFGAALEEHWYQYLDPTKLQRKHWNFNFSISTDGVQASIHYWKLKPTNAHNGRKINILEHGRGLFKDCELKKLKTAEWQQFQNTRVCVGIDPGRNQLISTSFTEREKEESSAPMVLEPVSSSVNSSVGDKRARLSEDSAPISTSTTTDHITRSFSKREWYETTGLNTLRKRRAHFLYKLPKDTKVVLNKTAEASFRTARLETFLQAWHFRAHQLHENKRTLDDTAFEVYGHTLFCNHKFYRHQRKQKFLAYWVSTFLKLEELENKAVVVAFGNGRFPTSAKGEKPGPGRSLAKKLSEKVVVILTDECRTSQQCHLCHGDLSDAEIVTTLKTRTRVPNPSTGKLEYVNQRERVTKKVHAIRRCTTNECSVYHDRDVNARQNIRQRLLWRLEGVAVPEAFHRRQKQPSVSIVPLEPVCTTELTTHIRTLGF